MILLFHILLSLYLQFVFNNPLLVWCCFFVCIPYLVSFEPFELSPPALDGQELQCSVTSYKGPYIAVCFESTF